MIIDDPLSADGANSDAKLEAVKTTFLETVPTRINSDASAIVVIMQRLHEKDTSGIILGDGLPYVHLCIPMRFEPDRRCTTSIGWTDPRTATGELMFPERFGEVQVSELERTKIRGGGSTPWPLKCCTGACLPIPRKRPPRQTTGAFFRCGG